MIKLVLWDYTGDGESRIKNFLRKDVEIIRTLRPSDKDQAEFILKNDWDFVLIFEKDTREIFNEILKTMRAMNYSTENIIFAQDFFSWRKNPRAVYLLFEPDRGERFYRAVNFFSHRRWHHYTACTTEGISYVGTSKDEAIIPIMYVNNENHAATEAKIFHALAKKYYDINDRAGYFLDLGANIGTTGIYFIKKLASNLKLLAFEPDTENFKLLRINLILNDMEEKATAINCGLGDKFEEKIMYRTLTNPGGNGIFPYKDNLPTETIKIIPLDSYFAENNISTREVKFIWIDVEGFEPQVLLGAKNLLSENPAPIFMEFNPMIWNRTDNFEKMVALLKAVGYTHWIWIQKLTSSGEEKLYSIDELLNWRSSNHWIGSLGDIFLLKK